MQTRGDFKSYDPDIKTFDPGEVKAAVFHDRSKMCAVDFKTHASPGPHVPGSGSSSPRPFCGPRQVAIAAAQMPCPNPCLCLGARRLGRGDHPADLATFHSNPMSCLRVTARLPGVAEKHSCWSKGLRGHWHWHASSLNWHVRCRVSSDRQGLCLGFWESKVAPALPCP